MDTENFNFSYISEWAEGDISKFRKNIDVIGQYATELIDGIEDVLREDIQVYDGEDLLIVEVKGIGGTSTDAECSQVAKHRRRREKENRDKNVIPIYIVNHQRYINPKSRENPPFSRDQIDYAKWWILS